MVATASSEETPTEDPMGGEGYSVAFDPLVSQSVSQSVSRTHTHHAHTSLP